MTAARLTTITNTVQNPGSGAPVVGREVSIRLNTIGFVGSGTAEKVKTRTVTTDDTGTWSVALEVNADIDPADTYYTVQEFAGLIWTFVVPYSATPLTLRSCLVDAPTNSDPLTAGVPLPSSTVPSGYVWTTDGDSSGDYSEVVVIAAVDSVNGHTGAVVLAASDVGADAAGAAAAAQAAAIAASQPLDSDLTAIAALTTTSYGRALLALADAAAGRTALALGTAAVAATGDFDAAGAAATAQAASQPLDSDLTAIAALTTTTFGRSFLALVDAAAGRTLLGLGSLATQSGTFSGTSSGTNTGDQDLSPFAPLASPALTGSPTAPTQATHDNSTKIATTAYADAGANALASRMFITPKSGEYLRSQFCSVFFGGGGPAAAGDMFASPVFIPATQNFVNIAVRIWTGTASSVVRLGMYADDGTGRPGALLSDYGTVTAASSGLRTVSITYAGIAGTLVWLVAVPQVAVPTFVAFNLTSSTCGPFNVGMTSATFDSTDSSIHAWYVASVTGALPSTPTWTVYSANSTRVAVVALVAA